MLEDTATLKPVAAEPMDPRITSIQPGGGLCMRLELAWGYVRRWLLRIFRPEYVRRMHRLRTGTPQGCPHEVLDPRDLKFYRNRTGDLWRDQDDPFRWRDRLPLARAGLGEVVCGTACALALTVWGAWFHWLLAIVPAALGVFIIAFFRNPRRVCRAERGQVLAPADGQVASVRDISYDAFLNGPAVEIGIFLSIFNVHINRSPVSARVISLAYTPGKFLNALRPASAQENEQLAIRLEETEPPYRRMIVRQIAGAIARRIVCWERPESRLAAGAQLGMIKFGSRTELVLPREDGLVICVKPGQKVKAGMSIVAEYRSTSTGGLPSVNNSKFAW